MEAALDKVCALAKDLSKEPPRSPKEPLADYAIAARALDKCRAELAGTQGDYVYACPLTRMFLDFAGITVEAFRDFVATGATDAEVTEWLHENGIARDRVARLQWSNSLRDKRLSELDPPLQARMEDLIADELPTGSRILIHTWFDVYDVEEGRLKP